MRVLVIGGAGFIGSHVVDTLMNNNFEPIVVDNMSTGDVSNIAPPLSVFTVDIRDRNALDKIIGEVKPDSIIHVAAQTKVQASIRSPALDAEINIMGSINVMELANKYGVAKVVYASSAAVYGDPMNTEIDEYHRIHPSSFYGVSKFVPEQYLSVYAQLYDMNYTILRYSNVYGPRQLPQGDGGVISIFASEIVKGNPVTIYGDGTQTRDFIYVKDVAEANFRALSMGDKEVFNISSNTDTSLNSLVSTLFLLTGNQVEITYEKFRPGDILHSSLDNNKARIKLGWLPRYGLEQGLRDTLAFYKAIKS